MKTHSRNMITAIAVCLLLAVAMIMVLPMPAEAASKTNTKYLTGIYEYDAEVFGAKHLSAKMIYKSPSKVTLKGEWLKGKNATRFVKLNKTYKISKKCKVVLQEMPKNRVYKWSKWRKLSRCRKNKRIGFVGCSIKIKNGKIVKITFGA